ncbi:MAG TPA: hypothetical protein PKK23_15225 [Nitrospirales bacterium]|nr:hypothetical protein [Nitrospirales bacterium]
MKVVTPVFVMIWIILSCVLPLQAEVIIERHGGEGGALSSEPQKRSSRSGSVPMRIEEPDGTLRPLPSVSRPESRMSTEGLQDVPDAGGGTMVNVEGRFQSILKVPDGAEHAIHQHDSEDPQALNP